MTRFAVLAVIALAGCKDEQKAASPAAFPTDGARMAALQAVAGLPNMPKTVQFRGVQAYTQSMPQKTAVCGQVSAFADDSTIFVPFVTVATLVSAPDVTPRRFEFDSRVGTSTSEATRVYSALVADCWERGGPAAGRPLSLPPLPDNVVDPRAPAVPDAAAPQAAAKASARTTGITGLSSADGSVTVRQSATVHADPKGPAVRTVSQGMSLHVFAQAPGGWYQVGDTAPFGWVHESMLNR